MDSRTYLCAESGTGVKAGESRLFPNGPIDRLQLRDRRSLRRIAGKCRFCLSGFGVQLEASRQQPGLRPPSFNERIGPSPQGRNMQVDPVIVPVNTFRIVAEAIDFFVV